MKEDKYKTISSASEGEFKEKGSKFLAYAFPMLTEAELPILLEPIRKLHPKARHFCYAYRLGLDKNNFRSNDDGEPSGTAGKPILGQIDSFEITNVFVVVVRYFGGTLLGTSGLIEAYRESTKDALNQAQVIDKQLCNIYQILFDYSLMSDVMNALKKQNIDILKKDFLETASIDVAIPCNETDTTLLTFKALLLKVSEEEAAQVKEIGGLKIKFLDMV
jgi:uncharacterized YigZ family protein